MYLFVVPQLASGSTSAYQLFFALFSKLTAVNLYLGLRAKDERLAMMAGLAYLAYPLGLMEFGIGAQDEAVTTFLFILPLVLMHLGKGGLSGLPSFIGVLTKMFNVLLVPWMFLQADKRNRVSMLVGFMALVLLLVVPFIILFPDQLPSFRYYFLGNPDYPTGGSSISPWHYLNELGFGLPGWAGVVLTLAGLADASLFAFWKKMSLWEGAALVVLAFFLFYPKILLVHFVMPAALLMMWGLEDRKVMLKLMTMIVPLYISVVITGNGMDPMADESWVWLLGIILSLIGWGLMFYTWWTVRTKRSSLSVRECFMGQS